MIRCSLSLFVVLALWSALAANAQQQRSPAPKVLGTAQSEQEFDAYRAVLAATNATSVAEAAERFGAAYPESGLAAYVHQSAVQAYYQLNDMRQVIRHGEAALQDLPANALLLGLVSGAYLDQQQPEKAAGRAQQAVAALGKLEPPSAADRAAWRLQADALEAGVRLTLGSALLEMALRAPVKSGPEEWLDKAVVNLREALAKNPRSEQASYRLGVALSARNDAAGAIRYYAWASALGGSTATAARTKLTELCRSENQSPEAAIAGARAEIERLAAAR